VERAGHRLARGHAQLVASKEVPDRELRDETRFVFTFHGLQVFERLDELRVDLAGLVEELAPLKKFSHWMIQFSGTVLKLLSCPCRAVNIKSSDKSLAFPMIAVSVELKLRL
jgi:hypothetical protein